MPPPRVINELRIAWLWPRILIRVPGGKFPSESIARCTASVALPRSRPDTAQSRSMTRCTE